MEKRTSQAEWEKRIERWKDSGLTAEQFAAEAGINAGTLRFWKYSLGKRARSARGSKAGSLAAPAAERLVEVRPTVTTPGVAAAFELELGSERRLRIPAEFDVVALERLLALLERR